jgi:hypothetical protein
MRQGFAEDAVQAPAGVTFLGVQNFQEWPAHLATDDSRDQAKVIVTAAYGVGIVGGLLWSGLRGALGGWAAAAALKHGIGTVVYLRQGQAEPAYRNVAALTGTVAVVDAAIARWLLGDG